MLNRIKKHHDFMWTYVRALALSLKRPIFVFLFFIALSACLVASLAFFAVEVGHNQLVQNFFDAFYFIVTTMAAVGYGDISPQTMGGRIVAMITMVMGTGIYATFTAVLATALIELEISREE
jgi:voltage-gated potassium channel